jgi:UPF0755 protein
MRIAIIAAVALAAGVAAWVVWGQGPRAPGGSVTVVLRPGEGITHIAADLVQARAIRSGPAFIALAEITGAASHLKAGEYAFISGASLARVLDAIRHGRIVRRYVTVPEGLASVAVAQLLSADPVLTGPAPVAPEGSLLPDTYEVRRGESRAEVEARMTKARATLLAQLWRDRTPGLPYRTPQDAVILASIVEKETGLAAERPRVAGVFVNRLERGMRLASDPTVVYGLTHGRPLGHGLTVTELARITPWNTYRVDGLPPTPIANPGRAALQAALAPARTDDLYFVADGTGGHAFAATLEAHEANVKRWRAFEQARTQKAGG